jgi:phospholipid/cholesterol/gamma-HCH transport system substrate-binding protein
VDSTEDISKELRMVLAQIKKVLNDENVDNLSKILERSERSLTNIEEFSSYLVKNQKKIVLKQMLYIDLLSQKNIKNENNHQIVMLQNLNYLKKLKKILQIQIEIESQIILINYLLQVL